MKLQRIAPLNEGSLTVQEHVIGVGKVGELSMLTHVA
jgi:hypothetical protein